MSGDPATARGPWPRWAVALGLAVVTLVVYSPVRGYRFVDYDDDEYVFRNPRVQAGLETDSVVWAFTTMEAANWHPLTWLSHMLDCQLFGLDPAGHHLVSVALHAANAALLFLALSSLTGSVWPSAFVAALFALHPLNVESVAWVAERKNVLCAFFWILTLAAYGWYARRPGPARYLAVAALFALALLSKPMAVSLPLVLLLLDFWPLGRMTRASAGRLCLEKLPLVAMAALASAVTFQAHLRGGSIVAIEAISPGARVANAIVSYVAYAWKLVWPARLGVFYPHREGSLPMGYVVAATVALVVVTAATLRAARRAPYLAVGWLFYLVTLLPVIGIVQVGAQAMADRYAYIPAIGLFLALAWGAADLARRAPAPRAWAAAAALALAALTARTVAQVPVWRDSLTLFAATVAAVPDSWVGHYNLGNGLSSAGRPAEAETQFRETVRLQPRFARAHNNLGDVLDAQGRHGEAVAAYTEAIRVNPQMAEAHNNLGTALAATGRLAEAVAALEQAVALQPRFAEAYLNLGIVLRRLGRLRESGEALDRAVTLRPELDLARYQRAVTALQAGDTEAARRDLDVLRGRNPDLAASLSGALQRPSGPSGTPGAEPARPGKP
jgi:tetratricopeptide (TPR) repeat protein